MKQLNTRDLADDSERRTAIDPKERRRRAGFASKELIQKTIPPQQSDGPQYTQRKWMLSLEANVDWLPDQGSNLGPAD